jgi:hypothetical protein
VFYGARHQIQDSLEAFTHLLGFCILGSPDEDLEPCCAPVEMSQDSLNLVSLMLFHFEDHDTVEFGGDLDRIGDMIALGEGILIVGG